jgi:TolB-like protein
MWGKRSFKLFAFALAGFFAGAFIGTGEVPLRKAAAGDGIAILSFEALDASQVRLAESLSEEVLKSLAGIPGVRVRPSTVVRQAQRSPGAVTETAKAQGARYVLEGVLASGSPKIRLVIELRDSRDEMVVFSKAYDGAPDALSGLVASVVWDVASRVTATPDPAERRPGGAKKASRVPAYLVIGYLLLLATTAALVVAKRTRWPSLIGVALMPPYFVWVLLDASRSAVRPGRKGKLPAEDLVTAKATRGGGESRVFQSSGAARSPLKAISAAEPLSEEASACIVEALGIIDSQVALMADGTSIVSSTGSEGKVMEAARKFEEALRRHPDNPFLRYAYAASLHLALQHKSAENEMRRCAETHPDFILARLALEGWGKWQPVFKLPPWGPATAAVHPAISRTVKTSVLVSVSDAAVPRAAVFLRDAQGDFRDLRALQSARIALASVVSPVRDPQVIGIYAKIFDNPADPYGVEILEIPFRPRGDSIRSRYEYLCLQDDVDFIVLDRDDRILVNKRLPIPPNMRAENARIFRMLEASDGSEFSAPLFMNAILEHQRKFAPSSVRY